MSNSPEHLPTTADYNEFINILNERFMDDGSIINGLYEQKNRYMGSESHRHYFALKKISEIFNPIDRSDPERDIPEEQVIGKIALIGFVIGVLISADVHKATYNERDVYYYLIGGLQSENTGDPMEDTHRIGQAMIDRGEDGLRFVGEEAQKTLTVWSEALSKDATKQPIFLHACGAVILAAHQAHERLLSMTRRDDLESALKKIEDEGTEVWDTFDWPDEPES